MAATLLDASFKDDFCLSVDSFDKDVQSNPDFYRRYRLTKATHYKEKTYVGHEYIILDISDGKHFLQLRTERRPTTRKGETVGKAVSSSDYVRVTDDSISRWRPSDAGKPPKGSVRSSSKGGKSLNEKAQSSKGKDKTSSDKGLWRKVTNGTPKEKRASSLDDEKLSEDEETAYLIQFLRCPAVPAFTVVDICQIFHDISAMSPNYRLLSQQCYWFCGAFIDGLKLRLEDELKVTLQITEGRHYDRRGKTGGVFRNLFQVLKDEQPRSDMEIFNKKLEKDRTEEKERELDEVEDIFNQAVKYQTWTKAQAEEEARRAIGPILFGTHKS
ncbi:hypothetical protein FRC03_000782 [Tulasnella sp. 419]|nr:hypothetical protein FRC03_000782 [Tulasnella sp. 419]